MKRIQKEIEDNGAYYIQKSFYRHLWASNKSKCTKYFVCGKSGEIMENEALQVLTLLGVNYVLCGFFQQKSEDNKLLYIFFS